MDPAIEIASCFEAPTTPLGYDELQAAGAIRNKPVELVQCLTINEKAIANAEYVIEGEIYLENVFVRIYTLTQVKQCRSFQDIVVQQILSFQLSRLKL